jgi:hypothetical protein
MIAITNPNTKKSKHSEGRIATSNGRKTKTETMVDKLTVGLGRGATTAVLDRLYPRGGAPEFNIDDINNNNIYGRFSRSDNADGNRTNRNGNGSGNRSNRRSRNSDVPFDSGSTRGYSNVSGQSCLLWSSGIRSGLTVNTRIVSKDYTPLYLSSGWLFKTTDTDVDENTYYNSELNNIIYPLVESIISNTINRYAGRYINVNKFNRYFEALTESLQIYYCIDSVLAYRSNVTIDNTNVGMESLSSKLTAEAVVQYNLLKETLMTCCCPSNLLEYVRFMCQSYRTSDAPHSSILKLNIGGMFDDNWTSGTSAHIEQLLKDTRLKMIKSNEMTSYLNQAFPEWLIGNPPSSSLEACFNKDFMLFWHNQNCCYLSPDATRKKSNLFDYTLEFDSIDDYIDYQINTRDIDVDGVMFVSTSYFLKDKVDNSLKKKSYWGIWQPLASIEGKSILEGDNSDSFNIKCLNEFGQIKPVLNPVVISSAGIHFMIEYTGNSGNKIPEKLEFGTHGFVKLQNVSVRMQNEAFNNVMRFLYL